MKQFTDAVRQAVSQENWYAALSLALTLPDICGRLEDPAARSQARYVAWCQKYLEPRYTLGDDLMLSGRDCYALRCAVLHEGSDDVVNQRAREALEAFIISVPLGTGMTVHCNRINQRLQLQVDILSEDIAAGVDMWSAAVADQPEVATRISNLMVVHGWRAVDPDDPTSARQFTV